MTEPKDRCRLMLAAGPGICDIKSLADAMVGGDVASVILCDRSGSPVEFSSYCDEAVRSIQDAGAAALVMSDTQTMGRTGADGIYVEENSETFRDTIARFSPQKIVGCGGMMDRDAALKTGELYPDFVLFGKLGRDIKPEPHPKNIAIAQWWSEFVELPGVLPGGSDVETLKLAAATGIDFVVLEKAVFAAETTPCQSVKRANELLDKHAPRFSEEVS